MAEEIELKLSIDPKWVEAFKRHALLANFNSSSTFSNTSSEPLGRRLANTYFDTPDQQLNRHAVALRIREFDGRFIQTLKTRGESRGGLHQRQEWEWEVPGAVLDVALLPAGALPDGVDLEQLRPAFRTDFQRTRWLIDWQGAVIELVLDQGEASSAEVSQPICEIELELKSGSASALFDLAVQLAQDVPLHLCDVSKAERGYRLADPQCGAEAPTLAAADAASGERIRRALAVWAWALDRYQFEGSSAPLRQSVSALDQLLSTIRADRDCAGLSQAHIHDLEAWRLALGQALDTPSLTNLLNDSKAARSLLLIASSLHRE